MACHSRIALGLVFCSGLFIAACATDGTMGSGSASAPSAQTDTLQACLSRAAASGSPGARMVAEESCRRDEALRQAVVGTASTKSQDRVASGTQGDTLEACLARIPKDATAGQRMLAEESCKRDQANRR